MLRLFFGVMLPAEIQQELAAVQSRLAETQAPVRWTAPHNFHLTLRFLGEMSCEIVDELRDIGWEIAKEISAWQIQLRGVGAFPKSECPKIIWAGVGEGKEALQQLSEALNQALAMRALVKPESKPFHPHCTLGRVITQDGLCKLIARMQEEKQFASTPFLCDAFQLVKSVLRREGPIYEVVATFAFP